MLKKCAESKMSKIEKRTREKLREKIKEIQPLNAHNQYHNDNPRSMSRHYGIKQGVQTNIWESILVNFVCKNEFRKLEKVNKTSPSSVLFHSRELMKYRVIQSSGMTWSHRLLDKGVYAWTHRYVIDIYAWS